MKPQGEAIRGLLWDAVLTRESDGSWALHRRAFPLRWIVAQRFPTLARARRWIAERREDAVEARAW